MAEPQGQQASVKMAFVVVAWASCLLLVTLQYLGQVRAEVTNGCMRCICEAVTGGPSCEFGGSCHDGVCGPYSITLPYWKDGGRPTVGLDNRQSNYAYEKCTLDKTCAEATIRGYMSKFQQDCNGDKRITCEDYAAIHFHGGFVCNQPLSPPAMNALNRCLQRVGETTQSISPPAKPQNTNDNDIAYPPEQTTLPQIDIRFGD